ncbi:MAG: 50S ribosomal protein L30 [Oscillospiraceae bacterium]|jgi:large subunit ribosomal protein L30|nr:50S ribosomal protein L30 [Oscillospiraceae bacterium]
MATLKLTLIKSTIGSTKKQLATAEALGLRRIGDVTANQPDNAATRGKIRILAHLLKVEGGDA